MKIKIESICNDLSPFLKILKKYNFESKGIKGEGYITLNSIEEIYEMIKELDKIELEGITNDRGVILDFSLGEREKAITIIDGYLG